MLGGGDACAALLSPGEGERGRGGGRAGGELEGERGSVGEKDRIPEEAQTH